MNFQETLEYITGVIRQEFNNRGLEVTRIVLFGSRSRGNAGSGSDWDFLVGIKNGLSFPEKNVIVTEIQGKLAEKFIDADIIIKSEARLAQERDNVGVITYYALKEGIPV